MGNAAGSGRPAHPVTLFPVTAREEHAYRSMAGGTGRLPATAGEKVAAAAAARGAVLYFPMFLMSWEVLHSLKRMTAHQVLKRRGQLVEWTESLLGRVLLVSHEWLGYSHPDPAGEQLDTLKGVLRHTASGQVTMQCSWIHQLMLHHNETVPSDRLASALPGCFFWLDYSGVPQKMVKGESRQAEQMMAAVYSIPAYIERAAALLVLTPVCQHRDAPDRVCNFSSWRGRGWCRVELFAALLARTRVRLLRCVSASATPEFMYGADAFYLPPGEGQFTCCDLLHCIGGQPVECDKMKLAVVMDGMVEAAAEHLGACGDVFRKRILICNRARYLRGMACPPVHRGGLRALEEQLHWEPSDVKEARAGRSWSLLHWAAFAGNAEAIRAILVRDPTWLEVPARAGAPELGVAGGYRALHLAAFSADGRPDALEAMLDAGADASVRCGPQGCDALMVASDLGTVAQLSALLAQLPPWWNLDRPNDTFGAPAMVWAAFCGPGKAGHVQGLRDRGADVRVGNRFSCQAADAALFIGVLKDDSDPEVVKLLLACRSDPNVPCRPAPAWRACLMQARLCARLSRVRGGEPGPLVKFYSELEGATPLHLVSARGDVLEIKELLAAQADPSRRTLMGRTPLQFAERFFGGTAPPAVAALLPPPAAAASEGCRRSAGARCPCPCCR